MPTEKCFTHADGRWIEKSESPFNWEEHDAGGELVSRLWVTEQKLANGVDVAAELWTLFGQQPGRPRWWSWVKTMRRARSPARNFWN